MKKKPKTDHDDFAWDESLPYILGVGSYQRATVENRRKHWPDKRIVGFVRPKVKVKRTK